MIKWIEFTVVMLLLARAVYTDVAKGKIENMLMIIGFTAGLLFAYIGDGLEGLLYSARMTGMILLALFFLFAVKGLGAGDIKLLCVLAAFFPESAVSIVIISFFAGAVIAIGRMFIRWLRKEMFFIRKETINFSIPIALGTLVVFFWR